MRYFALCLLVSLSLSAQEWTRFRGPNGTGISSSTAIPTNWNSDSYKWTINLPGRGHSSPVLWGEKLFITSTDDNDGGTMLLCYDAASGKNAWQRNYSYAQTKQHKFNSFATSTPAVDGERVYFTYGNDQRCMLLALTHDGKDAWEAQLGPIKSQHGFGFSPIVEGGRVIVQNEQLGVSYLAAFDAKTGAQVWQTKRESGYKTAYSTACVYTPEDGEPQLIFNSQAGGIYALSLSDGEEQWRAADVFAKRTVASPIVADGLVFGSGGAGQKGDRMVAVRMPSKANPKAQLAYDMLNKRAPYVPTGVVHAGMLFLVSDTGNASCHEVATGQQKWIAKLDASGGFFGSPVCVNGIIYVISKSGDVAIFAAADSFQAFDTVPLGEESYATPSVANDRMYLRTARTIYCLGK